MNLKEFIKKGLKFCATGGLNTLIDFTVTTVLNRFLFVNIYIAKPIGYLLSMVNSFIVNKKWTFKTEKNTKKEFLKFSLVNLCMLGASLVLISVFKNTLQLSDFWSNVCATAIVSTMNFIISNFWVFKE